MKKTMRLFAVLCAVTLALFAACANDDDNGPTKYTVTFDSKGGSPVATQPVENGERAIEPKDPSKDGVIFGGWYNGENPFHFSTAITSNITLTAKWISERYEADDVKLTFHDDGTFEYTDKDGTTWNGTYEISDDGKITGEIEGKDGDSSLEVDTSGGSPSVSVGGEKFDGEFEDTTSKNDPNKNPDSGESDEYAVGKIVTISNVKYLVIKNTEDGSVLGAQASYGYYPNARADLYRDHLIEQLNVAGPYVIVFNTETAEKTVGSTSSYDDEYRILRDGTTYHRIRYRWENLITDYAGKTTSDLRRNYDPSCFVVDNYSADYGTDLSKKFFRTYRFDYGKDGKTIAFSDGNWRLTDDYKDYVYITATRKERNQYSITDRINDNARSYILRNPNDTDTGNGNSFFEFRVDFDDDGTTPSGYRLIANGKGTVQYTAGDYKNTLRIYSFKYYSADNRDVWFRVDAGNNSYVTFDDFYEREEYEYEDDGKGNAGWSSPSDDKESSSGGGSSGGSTDVDGDSGKYATSTKAYVAYSVVKNEGVSKYVTVSKSNITVNDISVPSTITFTIPFENEDAPLGKFTTVTFVPQAKDSYVIYVPEKGSKADYKFIDDYKDGYNIFGEYSLTRP